MGYIEKKVSCQAIISKIFKTIKPSDSTWVASTIEEIGWAIQAIGYHAGFEQLQTPDNEPIIVSGHRARLPKNCERVLFVEEYIPYSTSLGQPHLKTRRLRLGTDIRAKSFSDTTKPQSLISASENYYDLQGDFIVTGHETCKLKVHYIGFDVDSDGMPLIIDDFDYKTAIFWHCIGALILSGYKVPDINFIYCDQKFEQHKAIAQNNVKMPSIDGMESFASSFLRISSNSTRYENYSINLERPEYKDF